MPKDGKGMALMIGLGKPKGEAGSDLPEDDELDGGGEKDIAGSALKDALDSGDGAAICEAVKRIMELESYPDEEA